MKPLLFSGIEVEGTHKGKKTLFVQGRVSYNKIVTALNGSNYEQVYFGAKYKDFSIQPSDIDIEMVLKVKSIFGTPVFTVEYEASDLKLLKLKYLIYNNIQLILVIRYINHIFNIKQVLDNLGFDIEATCQIKLFSGSKGVIIINLNDLNFTDKDQYSKDKLVLI
jgi:hypothetical protein